MVNFVETDGIKLNDRPSNGVLYAEHNRTTGINVWNIHGMTLFLGLSLWKMTGFRACKVKRRREAYNAALAMYSIYPHTCIILFSRHAYISGTYYQVDSIRSAKTALYVRYTFSSSDPLWWKPRLVIPK